MKRLLFLFLAAFLFGIGAFFIEQMFTRPGLAGVVEEAMAGAKGKYGIFIENLKTGESYYKNEHEVFEIGSLYKLWVMAEAFSQIKEAIFKENDVLSQDAAVLNAKFGVSVEEAELKEGQIEMTISEALQQMITISHNYASLLLSEKLKNSQIAEFLETQELRESSLGDSTTQPRSTPKDIALFYDKLYKGEIVDNESSQKMLELLKRQNLNDGIPKYIPKDVAIAHKTGDIGWFKHDAGIVFTKRGDYIIVVMSESDYPLGAQELIAKISEAVYNYFNQKRFFGG